MLGRVSKLRHAITIGAIAGTTTLTAVGVIGDVNAGRDERYDAIRVLVMPAGTDSLGIIETIDQDFGDNQRHGTERDIPNDYGAPIYVQATSADAPDQLSVENFGDYTRIRIGDPNRTVTGQHRYVLTYTLPEANLVDGTFALDAIGAYFEYEIARATVVIDGITLSSPRCYVGGFGSTDTCQFEQSGGLLTVEVDGLAPRTGITIDGTIEGFVSPSASLQPPPPNRRSSHRLPLTAGVAGLGAIGALPVYLWARRKGRNEVFAGGAADAAHGRLPAPNPDGSPSPLPPTTLVPDDELADLATIEFAPPKGIDPWQAQVLLTEKVGSDTVEAWLSGLAGKGAIELEQRGRDLAIKRTPELASLPADEAAIIHELLNGKAEYETGSYDPRFAAAWKKVASLQRGKLAASGWWKRMTPGTGVAGSGIGGASSRRNPAGLVVLAVFVLVWGGSTASALLGAFRGVTAALVFGLVFPAVVALFVYRALLPARSATGSALALQAESFRRFLHASEGTHVEWAWSHGLLREYSGWAVALGEAEAWSSALARANVPEPERASVGPIIVVGHNPSLRTSHTPPSQSGSGDGGGSGGGRGFGGGGFSGGSVGGGGGGGGGSSW